MLQNTIETLNYVLFLLPGETFTERTVYVGSSATWQQIRMLKCTLRRKHNTQTAVIIGKTSKENNGTYCFFTENKKGNASKRSYSGGRLLKSFRRHVRILQKPMQEKERKIDPSSCKSYIYEQKKKKKSSNWTNDTACSQEAIWLSTVISLEITGKSWYGLW